MYCSVCLDWFDESYMSTVKCPYCGQDPLMFDYAEREAKAIKLENFDYPLFRTLLGSLHGYQNSIKDGHDPKKLIHPFLKKQVIQISTIRIVEKKPKIDENTVHDKRVTNSHPEEPMMCDLCHQTKMFYVKYDKGKRVQGHRLLIRSQNIKPFVWHVWGKRVQGHRLLTRVPNNTQKDGKFPRHLAYCENCNQIVSG